MFVPSAPVTTAPAMLPPNSDINKNTSTTTIIMMLLILIRVLVLLLIIIQWPCSRRRGGSGEAALGRGDDCWVTGEGSGRWQQPSTCPQASEATEAKTVAPQRQCHRNSKLWQGKRQRGRPALVLFAPMSVARPSNSLHNSGGAAA